MDTFRLQKISQALLLLGFLVIVRLLPHPPNTTPLFCATLVLTYFLPRHQAMMLGLLGFMLSDMALSLIGPYAAFGQWTFFTYSGFIAAFLLGDRILKTTTTSWQRVFYALVSSTFFFWVWTNFGVWLGSVIYPKTSLGLASCFTAAIPFLNNALLGQLGWAMLVFMPLLLLRGRLQRSAVLSGG